MRAIKRGVVSVLLLSLMSTTSLASQLSDWAVEPVNTLKAETSISSDFYRDYDQNIDRRDFAYLMYNLYESVTGLEFETIDYELEEVEFIDTEDFYVREVARAGIIAGYGDGRFGPDELVTREQMATMYVRLLNKARLMPSRNIGWIEFKDSHLISRWAMESVKLCYSMGIINGVGDNRIDPAGNATREASLVIYSRIYNSFKADASEKHQANATYRALLIGNQNYEREEDRLKGAHGDLERMKDTLGHNYFGDDNTQFKSVGVERDLSGSDMLKAIEDHFSDVKEGDVSYFYYSGHGGKDLAGRSALIGIDREFVSVDQIEKALNAVPGKKVVIIDACNSGGFISRQNLLGRGQHLEEDFNRGVIETFSKRLGFLNKNQYKVITSASADERAYELRFSDAWGGELTRYYTEGLGYKDSFKADGDGDGDVTLREAGDYLRRRVLYSNVQVFPSNDSFTIASKKR